MEKNIVIFVEPEETIDPTEFDAEGKGAGMIMKRVMEEVM